MGFPGHELMHQGRRTARSSNLVCTDNYSKCELLSHFFKIRRKTVQDCSSFTVSDSYVRIKDRRESRSLHDVPLITLQPRQKAFIEDELFIWSLARLLIAREGEDTNLLISVPTWNGFYEIISECIHNPTTIGYGPLFPKSPTDSDVVKTSLDYLVSLSLKLGQQTTVITVDQAIYDIVKGKLLMNKHICLIQAL